PSPERDLDLVGVAVHVAEDQVVAAVGELAPPVERAADRFFELCRGMGASHQKRRDGGQETASREMCLAHTHPQLPESVRYSNGCSLTPLLCNMLTCNGQAREPSTYGFVNFRKMCPVVVSPAYTPPS